MTQAGYSYIKGKYRNPDGVATFGELKFHIAPLTVTQLRWKQRWLSVAALLSPRGWWWCLRHEWKWRVAEFRTGWRYEIGVK